MTVTVTLPDGNINEYMRFGDSYVEHGDGSLNVHRTGANEQYHYEPSEWTGVQGDVQKGMTKKSWQFWKK
jgi:hypothetical protein